MIRVFCVDLGYSLKTECKKWMKDPKSYPGQALYGVNHFKQYQVTPVFEWCEHGYLYGKWYAFIDEFIKLISLVRYYHQYDLIYIPHGYYSRWIILLKWLGLLKKPVVVCLHNKNNLWKFIQKCEAVITINPRLAKELNIEYIPLLPESNVLAEQGEQESVSGRTYEIVSIGNTHRDYEALIEAMRGLPYHCLIVTSEAVAVKVPDNVTVIHEKKRYEECLKIYGEASVIVLPIEKNAVNGVFGLTGLVDALCAEKPLIITKTAGMGIPIQKYNMGIEVEAGNVEELREAIGSLMNNVNRQKVISMQIRNFRQKNPMEKSAGAICRIFKEIVEK